MSKFEQVEVNLQKVQSGITDLTAELAIKVKFETNPQLKAVYTDLFKKLSKIELEIIETKLSALKKENNSIFSLINL